MTDGPRSITWLTSLEEHFLKLPVEALLEVKQATQTLGGILDITNNSTFVPIADIAKSARLPRETAEKHLKKLHEYGWIANEGRGRTRTGRPRRTNTLVVTKRTKDAKDYLPLPWWAFCKYRNQHPLKWSEQVMVALIMRTLMSLSAAECQKSGDRITQWFEVDELGGNRFTWSLSKIERETGLSRPSIVAAKRSLHDRGMIDLAGQCDGITKDSIEPDREFAVTITPAGEGMIWIDLGRQPASQILEGR